jgi:hypothetical protein
MRRVGPHPGPGHELIERLTTRIEQRQLACAPPAPDLIIERLRLVVGPDLARPIAAYVVALAHTPHDLTVLPNPPLDHAASSSAMPYSDWNASISYVRR